MQALGLGERIGAFHERVLWASNGKPSAVAKSLRERFAANSTITGALLEQMPSEGELWIAAEWWGRLVVSRSLMPILGDEISSWQVVQEVPDPGLVVLEPRERSPAERLGQEEFRAALDSSQPATARAHLKDVREAPERWFGELADPRVGGASVLLALAARRCEDSIVLRNPAALGMELDPVEARFSTVLREHGVTIGLHAVTWSDGVDRVVDEWRRYEDALSHDAVAAEFHRAQSFSEYGVLALLRAGPVDPTIEIPAGAVLEQPTPFDAQHLAVARGRSVTVGLNEVVPVALPAWCLNDDLTPPRGEQLHLTPLRAPFAEAVTQGDVWEALDARLQDSS